MNKDYSDENSMTCGLGYEESHERDQPEFDSADYYADKYGKPLPLDEQIKDLIFEINESGEIRVFETMQVLKQCLKFYEDNTKRVASLADDFEAAQKKIEDSLMGKVQA